MRESKHLSSIFDSFLMYQVAELPLLLSLRRLRVQKLIYFSGML